MLPLLPNEDQIQVVDSVRDFMRNELPLARLRNEERPEVTPDQWRGVAELGLFCIGLPEEAGGVGLGVFDEVLVVREMGRVVASPSLLATIVAAQAAHAAGREDWRDALVSGERRAHLVVAGHGGADAYCVDQRDPADGALLMVVLPDGLALMENGFTDEGEVLSFDSAVTLRTGRLDLAQAAWRAPADSPLMLRTRLLLSAHLMGCSEEARDITVEYAKTRQQFGVAIGSFQAVKHRCTDMAVACELAWDQLACAAVALQRGEAGAATAVAAAKYLAANTAHTCGDSAIQVHGGIGYQAECDVHLFMKRAHLFDQAGGNRALMASLLAAA